MSNKITQEDKDELYQEKNLTGQLGNTKFYQSLIFCRDILC